MAASRARGLSKALSGAAAVFLLLAGLALPASAGMARAAAPLQGGVTLSLAPANAQVAVGGTTDIAIRVGNVTDLDYAELLLTFNPAVLEVVDADSRASDVQIAPGGFLGADAVVSDNYVDPDAGEIYFTVTSGSTPGNGSGVLATITFRGKAAGASAVSFDTGYSVLENTAYESIPYTAVNGSVTVGGGGGAPTATPAATATAGTPTASATSPAEATNTPATTAAATATSGPTGTPTATSSGPAATPQPTNTPVPSPRPTEPYKTRIFQIWPDRAVGVANVLLDGAVSNADTQVFSFGALGAAGDGPALARTYLRFPMAAFPPGTHVKRATLYVYVDSRAGAGGGIFGVYRVLAPWEDSGWQGDPATWPALLSSPIALAAFAPEVSGARFSAPAAAPRVGPMAQSPLPTPAQSPLATATTAAPTQTPIPTRTPTPGGAVTPSPSPTANPAGSPVPTGVPIGPVVPLEAVEGMWLAWDVTALARAWLAGEVKDYGVALAPVPDAQTGALADVLLARRFTAGNPETMPYLIADVEIHPVTPTPIPILPYAGAGEGSGMGMLAMALGGALLLLALALKLAARRGKG